MKKTVKELLLDIEVGIKNLRWFNVKPPTPIIHNDDNVVQFSKFYKELKTDFSTKLNEATNVIVEEVTNDLLDKAIDKAIAKVMSEKNNKPIE